MIRPGPLSLAILAFLLSPSTSGAETITLTVTAAPSIYRPMYQEIFDAFQRANPDIRISLRASIREYDELAQETLLGATVGDLPDLSIQGSNRIRLLVDRHLPVPLDQLIENDPEWSAVGVGPAAQRAGRVLGQTYGLGFSLSFPVVYYNIDLLTHSKCDPHQIPQTWPEIIALGKRIRLANPNRLGGFFQYANGWTFVTLVESRGGHVMTPDDSILTLQTKEALQGLKVLRAFGEMGQAQLDMTQSQARQAFAAGMIGILIDSSSNLASFERQAAGKFHIAVGPFPLQAGFSHLPAAGALSVIFARDPAKQKAAWRCVKFLCGATAQTIMGKRTAYVPVNRIAIETPNLLGRAYQQEESKKLLLSELPFLSGWYAFPGPYSAKIDRLIMDHMQQVVVLSEQPEAALSRMQEEIQRLLPRHGGN